MRRALRRQRTRGGVRYASLLLLLALFVTALAGSAQAHGDDDDPVRKYSVEISPTTTAAGSTATFQLKLKNHTSSTKSLGSGNFTVPAGFTVTVGATTPPSGKSWSATLDSGVIKFRAASSASKLLPGQIVSTQLTVATACNATSATWTSAARQENNFSGNSFQRVGSDPVLTVTGGGGGLASLAFVQQPTDTEKDSPITPAVTVRAIDACGNTATGATGNVSIALDHNPLALGGTLSQPLMSGVATFANLTVSVSDDDYTLVASKSPLSATSMKFEVVDVLCTSADPVCAGSDQQQLTSVTTTGPPSGGTMALTFGGFGGSFTCGGTARAVIGSQTTIDPMGYTQPIDVTFTWDKSITKGTGVSNFVFCLSKDDGATFFVVPKCGGNVQPTCEVKRNRSGAGHLKIDVRLAPNDPVGSLG